MSVAIIAITGFGMTRGRTAILEIDATTNQSIVGITTNSKILNHVFLWHLLRSMYWTVRNFAQGTQQPGLNLEILENFQIVYPVALQEQTQIASILSGVDATIETTQKVIEKTKRLKRSLMQQLLTRGINHKKFKKVKWLFGKEIEIPEEWNIKRLFELSDKKNDIVAGPFGSNLKVSDYLDHGIPIIRLQNIERNKFIYKNIQFISKKKAKELAYHSYMSSDLALAKLGDPIGKTCKIPKDFPDGIVVADVVRIRIKKKANQDFVEYILNSKICTKQYNKEKIGTTRPRINLEQVRTLQFPTPSVREQTNIASILSGVDAICSLLLYTKTHAMQTIFLRLWRVTTS